MLQILGKTFIIILFCCYGFYPVFGQDCQITEFSVMPSENCNDDGTYNLTINFEVAHAGNDFFDLIHGDEFLGFYSIADLPIVLPHFPNNDAEVDFLTVCVNDNPNCCASIEFLTPNCNPTSDCEISNIIIEAHECDENGMYLIDIAFDAENVGNEGFTIRGNGHIYGSFSYDLPFVTLGPFAGNGETPNEFVVIDNQFEACRASIEFEPPNCNSASDCEISNIIIEAHECDENGMYLIDIAFDAENVGNEGFTIRGNGHIYGSFSYDLPFVTLGPFAGNGETPNEFVVIDNQFEACRASIEFEPPNCMPVGDCVIFDVTTDALICQSEESFSLTLNFETQDANNDFFEAFLGDDLFGFYSLADLPVTFHDIPINADNSYDFHICINDHPDCCTSFTFSLPPGFCGGFNVWPGDGNMDNIANHFDLLHLGLAYGATGTARAESSIVWEGFPVADWADFFENNVNVKHADCNGDGIVNMLDVAAIEENYRLTHDEVTPYEPLATQENDPVLRFELPESGEIPNNTNFDIPIVLGSENHPVEELYGLAFTIRFDPNMVMPESIGVTYANNWMGQSGNNLMTLDRTLAEEGLIEVAITKIDHNEVSGFGEIARFVGMVDDILGLGVMDIGIEKVKAIQKNEVRIPIQTPAETLKIATSLSNLLPNNTLTVFPNPTVDVLYVQHHLLSEIVAIYLTDMHGRVLETYPVGINQLSIKNWASGIYLLKIETKLGMIYQKVMKY